MDDRKRFGSMTIDENTIFFISCNDVFPGLYRADLSGDEVECLGEVPWEKYYDENALIEKINDVLVIAPRWHKNRFLVYDLKKGIFQSFFLKQYVWFGDTGIAAFSNVVKFRDSLFFIGNKNGIIVEYCSRKKKFYMHNLELPKELSKQDLVFFWGSTVLEKNVLYLPVRKGGIFSVNLEDFHVNYIEIEEQYECFCMCQIDNFFYMLPYYGNKIMIFDLRSSKYRYIQIPIKKKCTPFMTVIDVGSGILLMPMFDEQIIAINKADYKVSKRWNLKTNDLKKEENKRQFLSIYRDVDENTYLQKNGSRNLWIFGKNGDFSERSFLIPFASIQEIFKSTKTLKQMFFIENMDVDLGFMMQDYKVKKNTENRKYGINIWEFLNLK